MMKLVLSDLLHASQPIDPVPPIFPHGLFRSILRARKKPRIMREYSNLDWIPPTSNIVERLFSLTRLTFTDYRKAILLENFESTLYLKLNGDLWDIQTIANIMNNN